jgi:uncharacterized protein (DUF1778 family)
MNTNLTRKESGTDLADEGTKIGVFASPRQLLLIEQAAAIGGKTLAEFMAESAAVRAEYILANESRLVLNEMSLTAILEAMDHPV